MAELQNEAVEETADELVEGSELAPETIPQKTAEAAPETTPEGDDDVTIDGVKVEGPDGVRKVINKKHFQLKEAERQRDATQKELDDLKAQAPQAEAAALVDVPALPDSFDDDYEAKIAARETAIATNAEFKAREAIRAENDAATLQESQRKQTEYVQSLESKFSENVTTLGVDVAKVDKAVNALMSYGADAETAHFIVTDVDGPLIAMYFESDLQAFDEFMQLTPMQRGAQVGEIKKKAAAFRPKQSETPAPAERLSGKTPPAERGPAGATFE